MSDFGKLKFVQLQPWRMKYLLLDDLGKLCHEAEEENDDLTQIGIQEELVHRRISQEEFRQAYVRQWKKQA